MSSEQKFLVVVGVVTLALLGGMIFLAGKSGPGSIAQEVQSDSGAKAELAETSYDWGQIKMFDGNATATFEVKNTGSSTLKLFNGVTTCACTSAYLQVGDIKSNVFGMHTKSNGVFEISPGQSAELTVIFDPAFHGPSGVGPIERLVILETNDPENPKLTFAVSGEVIQ